MDEKGDELIEEEKLKKKAIQFSIIGDEENLINILNNNSLYIFLNYKYGNNGNTILHYLGKNNLFYIY
jgi:hypothetical protein